MIGIKRENYTTLRRWLVAGLAAFWLLPMELGLSVPIPWATNNTTIVALNDNLGNVIQSLCQAQGVNAIISKKVSGTVNGRFKNMEPTALLNYLGKSYGLIWYYDGNTLYVYPAEEMTSSIVNLDVLKFEQFDAMLKKLDIPDPRYPIANLEVEGMVYVAGPPRYVSLITDLAQMAENNIRRSHQTEMAAKCIRLKRAWAYDIKLRYRNEDITVPGVATILQRLFYETPNYPHLFTGPQRDYVQRPQTVGKLGGMGLINPNLGAVAGGGVGPVPGMPIYNEAQYPGGVNIGIGTGAGGGGPTIGNANGSQLLQPFEPDLNALNPGFQADRRLNAVIVYDMREKLPIYEELIKSMDVPVGIVEINATILDINVDTVMEWEANMAAVFTKVSDDRTSVGVIDNRRQNVEPVSNKQRLLWNDGLSASFLLVNGESAFISRLRALQGEGKARILSRPSVMTLANIEAQLRDDKTFYVRVGGYQQVDLFNVTVGVLLQVTPMIIDEGGTNYIKMIVHVEDGHCDEQRVDNIPVVKTSSIDTQARILEGQSLLIGGYFHDERVMVERMVPFLGRIPLLGWLFKSRDHVQATMQRMFLITPRIISLNDYSAEESTAAARNLDTIKPYMPKPAEHVFSKLGNTRSW